MALRKKFRAISQGLKKELQNQTRLEKKVNSLQVVKNNTASKLFKLFN